MAEAASIGGVVERVSAYDAEDGYGAATLDDGRTVSGVADEKLATGLAYRFRGQWQGSVRRPGTRVFRYATFAHTPEANPDAALNFLIKIARMPEPEARAAVAARGVEAPRLIARGEHPAREDTRRYAAESLLKGKARECLFELLNGRGFPLAQLIRACVRKWGRHAAVAVENRPFLLLMHGMPGCGFKRVDALYLSLGHPPYALKRQMLLAWNFLATLSNGDTWHEEQRVLDTVATVFGSVARPERAIRLGIRASWLVGREDANAVRWLAQAEKAKDEATVAAEVRRLLAWEA